MSRLRRWHGSARANRDPLLGLLVFALAGLGALAVLAVYLAVLVVGAVGVVGWAWEAV